MKNSNSTLTTTTKTALPSQAWSRAMICQLAVIVLAFLFQLSGKHIVLPPPWNWVVLSAFILVGAIIAMRFACNPWIKWLSGGPFAITIITIVAVIGAVGTFIVQDPEKMDTLTRIGLRSLFNKPPFAAAILLMLLNLSMATGRRLASPRPGQIGFLLNHAGLILVILGMFAGTAQFQRITLHIHEGETVSQGVDAKGKAINLAGNVTLNKFDIDKYPPKLIAVEFKDNVQDQVVTDQQWVKKNHEFTAFNSKIQVLNFFPIAWPNDDGGWSPKVSHGLPAAHIRITLPDGKTREDWVVAGIEALGMPPQTADIDETHRIGLLEPEAKSFLSHLTIKTPGHNPANYILAVNKPVPINSWMLYQNSYEMTMNGRASIIEAVRDPALPVVYTGLIAMMFGAFVALWINYGKRKDTSMETNLTPEECK